ncbi:hypothetical protein, partial [Paenibacillus sp. A3]|uniref:hypothetical protein n=1 Tax=Paenibacillus sp. A3 TaxID=1337054 RepID=UPI000B0B4329
LSIIKNFHDLSVTAMYENEEIVLKTNTHPILVSGRSKVDSFLVKSNPNKKPPYCNDEYRRLLPEHVYKNTPHFVA